MNHAELSHTELSQSELHQAAELLWRISGHDDLSGLGGERSTGRWHTRQAGKRIVYLSANAATALVESLVNLRGQPDDFPDSFLLLHVRAAASVSRIPVDGLSEGWRDRLGETQAVGDKWLAGRQSALLIVPSARAPESFNYLLNPLHPDAVLVRVESSRRIAYDRRLFHSGSARKL